MMPLLVMVLLLSKSRSGWMAAITAIVVLFAISRQKNIYFILILLILITIPFVVPEVVTQRFQYTFTQGYHTGQIELFGIRLDTSTSARIYSALLVLAKFMDHPFFGHGITGFAFLDGQYFRNMAELGIFGLSAFIWLMATVHRLIINAIRLELPPRQKGMVMGFYAGFWAMLVHALSANTFIIVRIAEPFWCLAGLTVVAVLTHQPQNVKKETRTIPAIA
jgi:O-antigen ligase